MHAFWICKSTEYPVFGSTNAFGIHAWGVNKSINTQEESIASLKYSNRTFIALLRNHLFYRYVPASAT